MLNQKLQQKLLQKLSPQQIQMIKLLEIPTLEMEQRIKKELEENPALEEGNTDELYEPSQDESTDSAGILDEDVDSGEELKRNSDGFTYQMQKYGKNELSRAVLLCATQGRKEIPNHIDIIEIEALASFNLQELEDYR